jgi:hypothetical protein
MNPLAKIMHHMHQMTDPANESRFYTYLRLAFSRLDYEVAYRIDRLRRQRMASQRLAKLDTNLTTRITTLRELGSRIATTDQASLQDHIGHLQWMLSQIRGEASGMAPSGEAPGASSASATAGQGIPPRQPRPRIFPTTYGLSVPRLHVHDAPDTRDAGRDKGATEEIPIG